MGFPFFLARQSTVARHADDGLGRQIDVVRQMAGKVVGAELLARILAVFDQIAHPLVQQAAILLGESAIRAVGLRGRQHHQHVAALLHRHLIFEIVHRRARGEEVVGRRGLSVVRVRRGVDLTGGAGIAAHVVGREIVCPDGHGGELQHRAAQRVDQLRRVLQEQRNGRIAHVHGSDAAVGVVLLGQKRHIAAGRGDELVGAQSVPPRRARQRLIVLAEGRGIGQHARVRLGAAPKQRVELLRGLANRVGDLRAVSAIPRLAQVAEVVDGGNVVVGNDGADDLLVLNAAAPAHLQPVADGANRALGAEIEIAPVDGDVIA